ncbi:MAG: glycosyltransferase family 4 protein [Chloroflexi bacterium]|nr:glycosyltransferase family 4 protein [Chloroflexota bacterium]
MKILLLAPQPFYQERGTPIAVKLVLDELARRGDVVDVVTFHEGQDVALQGVRLHRIPRLSFIRNVRPGLSWQKLVCDVFVALLAIRLCLKTRYTVVHAVEESAFIALFLKLLWGVPYIYDMDSSLAEQVVEKNGRLALLAPLLRRLERLVVRRALVVVPVCDALRDTVEACAARSVFVLYDVPIASNGSADGETQENLRETIGGRATDGLLALYVGNLEPYQGIDLLLDAFAVARRDAPELTLAVIGGRADDIARYRARSQELGLDSGVHFLGPRPVGQLASYLAQADILVSPRISGRNTPMKIYSYLESGKPILATRLSTHTQVLDAHSALLTDTTPRAFGAGFTRLAQDAVLRESLGATGRQYARDKYSHARFQQTFHDLMERVQEESRMRPLERRVRHNP